MKKWFKSKPEEKKSDIEIEYSDEDEEDDAYVQQLRVNLSRLIVYAESADHSLQREVAEKLANEAVKPSRQAQIVEYGGLRLLVPLTKSSDTEVQRLSAHALANLSVTAENQVQMAREGAIEMLIDLLQSTHDLTLRQAAKALANLGVNPDNKRLIAQSEGIPALIKLLGTSILPVKIEVVAALANLAVNDENEIEIVRQQGLGPIVACAAMVAEALDNDMNGKSGFPAREMQYILELAAQCCRALRNLSVNPDNKMEIVSYGAEDHLRVLVRSSNERISQQAKRALKNLQQDKRK
mmetsp:Transcript_20177/g.34020  ORF Transcript_20177/g.34020 Transcript_20177/m.34020 type:complete len:296 (-) Transcript_20177:199-1086(-)